MLHRNSTGRRPAEEGISEVVGFVVILAVVMAGLSLYLTYAVPVQGREVEITEMDGVRAWFVDYKTGVDQLWLNSPLVPESETGVEPGQALFNTTLGKVTLRKVINAGTVKEKGFVRRFMPLLAPIPASAEVSARNTERFTISGWRNGVEVFTWTNTSPALGYASHNNYWFQQEYYYQLGGVFLRQWDPEGGTEPIVTVIASPPFSVYVPGNTAGAYTGYQTKVELVVVNMTAPTGGFGATSPIRVATQLDGDPAQPAAGIGGNEYSKVCLTFEATSTEAAQAWQNVFNSAALRNGLGPGEFTSDSDLSDDTARLEVNGRIADQYTNDVQLELLVAEYTLSLENVPTLIE
jgi:hypothetical protein